jgi:hypothetical protein
MQEKYFFGPVDDDVDNNECDDSNYASDDSEAGDINGSMFHDYDSEYEVEDFEDEDDMFDEEMEDDEFEEELFADEEVEDLNFNDEDTAEARKDIWSNIDWDKD